ncbi:MAG: GlsB/YeaQ/YmgE family stress response rane protein, partial [Sphingomonas bacterium]|nr:GlsB/YeaQ/YmgE family stress response rane protein [Sphingomonas bacterium]
YSMAIIIWLILGGVIGWLASIMMRTDGQQGIILNVVVGIVGAFIGGILFNHDMNNMDFTLPALIEAFIGAVILLAIVNLVRRGSVR